MDPVSIILSALLTGAAAAATDTASQAVKGAYQGLKGALQSIFKSKNKPGDALEEPDKRHEELAAVITDSEAYKDQAIIDSAKKLLSLAEKSGTKVYQVTAGKIGVVGDNTHIETQTF